MAMHQTRWDAPHFHHTDSQILPSLPQVDRIAVTFSLHVAAHLLPHLCLYEELVTFG